MNKPANNDLLNKIAQTVFPIGYDARRRPRFILKGGGYTVACERDDSWLDAFRSSLQVNIRDVSTCGIGIISKRHMEISTHIIIPSPQKNYLLRAEVVRSEPDPLFPKLYRTGLKWCEQPPHNVFFQWNIYINKSQLELFRIQIVRLIEQEQEVSQLKNPIKQDNG